MAKAKGIMTLVDGAQSLGAVNLNLHSMGCTFYTASTHKWLMGPFENGIIYVNSDYFNKIWPNIIGAGWKESTAVDENLCVLGQRNEPSPAALPETIGFHQAIGPQNIQKRIVQLNTYLKKKLREAIPQATFVTPLAPEFSGGIVVIHFPNKEIHEVTDKLYHSYGIATAPAGCIRLSPHIYNTMKDIDYTVKCLDTIANSLAEVMLILNNEDVGKLLTLGQVINAVEEAIKAYENNLALVPKRMHLDNGKNTLLCMPSWGTDTFGTKLVAVAPHNASKNLPVTNGAMLLNDGDRKSTRLNSSHQIISYAVFCLKKKKLKSD